MGSVAAGHAECTLADLEGMKFLDANYLSIHSYWLVLGSSVF